IGPTNPFVNMPRQRQLVQGTVSVVPFNSEAGRESLIALVRGKNLRARRAHGGGSETFEGACSCQIGGHLRQADNEKDGSSSHAIAPNACRIFLCESGCGQNRQHKSRSEGVSAEAK